MNGEPLLAGAVFLAGLASFFAPCTFPLMPAYIGILTNERPVAGEGAKGPLGLWLGTVGRSLAFVLGISTTFITLGFGAGALGSWMARYSNVLALVGGAIVVLMGLHQMGILRLRWLEKAWMPRFKRGGGAFALGLTLSFGWTPCVGPVLGAVLVTTATQSTQWMGAYMMGLYALGLSLPFVVLALASGLLLKRLSGMERHLEWIKRVGGAIVVLMGLMLMTGQLNELTKWLYQFSQ